MADKSDTGGGQLTFEIQAQRYSKGILENKNISVAREVPYTLFVNDREILSISTLPSNLKELFVGFLVSEGILVKPKETFGMRGRPCGETREDRTGCAVRAGLQI